MFPSRAGLAPSVGSGRVHSWILKVGATSHLVVGRGLPIRYHRRCMTGASIDRYRPAGDCQSAPHRTGAVRPLAPGYERWARILSMGQDGRWRAHGAGDRTCLWGRGARHRRGHRFDHATPPAGGSIRDLPRPERANAGAGRARGARQVCSRRQSRSHSPMPDSTSSLSAILRYVGDVADCMTEISRTLKPGAESGWWSSAGRGASGDPCGGSTPALCCPAPGSWQATAGPRSGDSSAPTSRRSPIVIRPSSCPRFGEAAGLSHVRIERVPGGGLVMWADKPARSAVRES